MGDADFKGVLATAVKRYAVARFIARPATRSIKEAIDSAVDAVERARAEAIDAWLAKLGVNADNLDQFELHQEESQDGGDLHSLYSMVRRDAPNVVLGTLRFKVGGHVENLF